MKNEPRPSGYRSYEELSDIARAHHLKDETLFCGYIRQPFRIKENDAGVKVRGYCAHFNSSCERIVKDGSVGYATDSCLLYTKLYGIQATTSDRHN